MFSSCGVWVGWGYCLIDVNLNNKLKNEKVGA
jgi:hypothetical protein